MMSGRVLVVDDDATMCELVQNVLTEAGLNVVAFTDSGEAEREMSREKFDAMFFDVRMPSPDGYELARRARSSGFNQKTPIVMIAGDGDPAVQMRGFEAGANFFLYKPFDRQRLLRIVRITQSTVQQERRRFHRVAVKCPIEIQQGGRVASGTTLDMSLNGVLACCDQTFPKDEQVNVKILLKSHLPPVSAVARVARVIGNDCMGIELERMIRSDSERLQEFLLPLILQASGIS
jgi:CheY-like chemotaxis protein